MPLLHPNQRKSFTITKDTALYLAAKLAGVNGQPEKLRFQSTANRNWVAKLARQRYGVETKVFAAKDQLFNPAMTVEGGDIHNPYSDKHYMTLYCAELDYAAQQRVIHQTITVPRSYNRREDYIR